MKVDTEALAGLGRKMQAELDDLCAQIFGHAGVRVQHQLAETARRRAVREDEPAAGEEDRQDARRVHRAGRARGSGARRTRCRGSCLKWRSIQKLKGTYVDALPALVNPRHGPRAHDVQSGGRRDGTTLSSSDPNLQNIPIRTPLGREIRAAFVAEPGNVLISADYSQIELRVLAHLSGDAALVEAFTQGIDIHDRTAERVFGRNSGLDTHELRRRAKIINYALLYGKTAFTLAKDIGVPQGAAQEFIDAYFAGFPAVRAFHRSHARRRAHDRRRPHAHRPPSSRPGDHEQERHDPLRGRARSRQHADSRHRRRRAEESDD